jgi:cell division protein FtsL
MNGESFEYAIKKDVRNNPIVREVDEERHREMWRSVAVGAFLVMVVVFYVWQRVELVNHGYLVESVQNQRAIEAEVARHLRLEIESLRSPARIQRLATGRLQMVEPGPEDAVVIERVVPASPPPRSIVASR